MNDRYLIYKDNFNYKEIWGYFSEFNDQLTMVLTFKYQYFSISEDLLNNYFAGDVGALAHFEKWLPKRKDSWRYHAKRQALINVKKIFEKHRKFQNFK